MKFVCNRCGVMTPEVTEKPEFCSTCKAGQEELTLVNSGASPTIEPTPESPAEVSSFGIQSSPNEIKKILRLVSIPSGDTPYKGFQKINLQLGKDKLSNYQVAPAEAILTILELDRAYFAEAWETGDIVLDSERSIKKMKVLGGFDMASIQVDNENKVVLHQAGTEAGFSDNLEDASHVIASKSKVPIPFVHELFIPKIDDDSAESEYKWHVTVNASTFNPLFEVTKESDIEYFPFILSNDISSALSTGVGDMFNPGMDGAFHINIPILPEESVLPDEKIEVEVGPIFQDVMKNLDGKIRIYFAGNELPLWILYEITKPVLEGEKTVEKVFGKMGYVIPPRSA